MLLWHVWVLLLGVGGQQLLTRASVTLEWAAPFASGGGYCSEAFSFVHALESTGFTTKHTLKVVQHGDSYNQIFVTNMRANDTSLLRKLSRNSPIGSPDQFEISICHSEPGAWSTPVPNYHTQPCPSRKSNFNIGRTMFETDRIPSGWTSRLAYMDEVWVPTSAAQQAFMRSGVPSDKLVIVPEPVDTFFYSKRANDHKKVLLDKFSEWKVTPHSPTVSSDTFVFLFVGKFEYRKGIYLLLRAFYEEFFSFGDNENRSEDVLLWILTSAYHSTDDFFGKIERFLLEDRLVQGVTLQHFLSRIVLYTDIPQVRMPDLYSAADVLVIPSRGEGWGRPHVEAMSCETPIIATNWSGPTAYLTSDNGFPLHYEENLVPAKGWEGHYWAEPSLLHLKELLRFTATHPEDVRKRGQLARRSMLNRFSFERIGPLVSRNIDRIEQLLQERQKRGGGSFDEL